MPPNSSGLSYPVVIYNISSAIDNGTFLFILPVLGSIASYILTGSINYILPFLS
nr:MAG TPA: hypothetical protein [Bacteriophage sp.]